MDFFWSLRFSFLSRPSKGAEQRKQQNKWCFLILDDVFRNLRWLRREQKIVSNDRENASHSKRTTNDFVQGRYLLSWSFDAKTK